jgi:hypothetical protein
MNRRIKGLVVAAMFALPMYGLVGSPATAHAEGTGVSDTLFFEGHSNAVVPLVGGSGSFSFDAGYTCQIESDGETPLPCTIAWVNGTLTNIVCGTFTADADIVVTEPNVEPQPTGDTISAHVHLQFTTGVGTITGSNISESDSAGEPTNYGLSGSAIFTKDGSSPPPPFCTYGFNVTATAVLTEGP